VQRLFPRGVSTTAGPEHEDRDTDTSARGSHEGAGTMTPLEIELKGLDECDECMGSAIAA
jgi:hypothetical protein